LLFLYRKSKPAGISGGFVHTLLLGDFMKRNWKTYLGWIALAEGVGALSGWLTREGTAWYNEFAVKPALSPPSWVFPVVWGILFALMGIGAARVSQTPISRERSLGLNLWIGQLIVNFFWSLIFFNLRAYGFALAWLGLLWVLVLWMIFAFRSTDRLAAWLQVPYLLWISFAAYLNWGTWVLN
jgi:tryptophan-rich sensory protein